MAATKKTKRKNANGAGSLIPGKNGYSARVWVLVDGERVRKCVQLGTDHRAAAEAKLKRLVSGEDQPEAVAAPESFEAAARRVVAEQGIRTEGDRMKRLEHHAFPVIGKRSVRQLRSADVRMVLAEAAAKGLSKQTVQHLRTDIAGVLRTLCDEDLLTTNVARGVKLPKNAAVDLRKRVVLTDAEFVQLISWPDLDPELRTAAMASRCLGGMRTSDLLAWVWEDVDLVSWTSARVPRPKTDTEDRLAIPSELATVLHDWWQRQGSPESGPVFPVTNGKRAGQRKQPRNGYVKRLRRALWAAGVRRGPTPEECSLQSDQPKTKRVDFHSFRRAFATGLARAGVNTSQSMRLAGHSTAETHMRYVRMTEVLEIPVAALPQFNGRGQFTMATEDNQAPIEGVKPEQYQTLPDAAGSAGRRRYWPEGDPSPRDILRGYGLSEAPMRRGETSCCQRTLPTVARAADAALAAYLRVLADRVSANVSTAR